MQLSFYLTVDLNLDYEQLKAMDILSIDDFLNIFIKQISEWQTSI